MPIIRIGPKLVHFAHVPKAGGTSVGAYLTERFGPPAFLERKFAARPEAARWTRSSPQHVPWEDLVRLVPPSFLDAGFAVVRHPRDRIVSAYLFALEVEEAIAPGTPFGSWLEGVWAARAADPFARDNHVRPMTDHVPPEGALPEQAVFRLEDGLDAVIPWLDAQAGRADGPRGMPALQRRWRSRVKRGLVPDPFVLSASERALVAELYAGDFARFGYDPGEEAPA